MNETNKCIEVGSLDYWGNDMMNRVYSADGISPTLQTFEGGNRQPKIIEDFYKGRQQREYDEYSPAIRADRQGLKVQEPSGIYTAMNTNEDKTTFLSPPIQGVARCLKANMFDSGIVQPMICASRGRNPDNPSDRTAGIETEQTFEVNSSGTSNTLTSVAKDNYVIEPNVLTPKRTEYGKSVRKDYENGKIKESRHNMTELVPKSDSTSNTITSVQKDNLLIEPPICRVRKLTPKECVRLMDFDDEDYNKMKAIEMSDSSIYKQCGNSIVVAVLEGIFDKMFLNTQCEQPEFEQLTVFDI